MAYAAVQAYYRRHASIYDATRWAFLFGRRGAVRMLGLRPESHVLELGCGTGLNFPLLLDTLSPDKGRLVGLDFSRSMLDRAATRVARSGWSNVSLAEADATQFDLGRTFDAVFICYALTMMPGWRQTLRLAHAHLRDGGRLVVHDFDRFADWGPAGAAMRWFQRQNHVDTDRPLEEAIAQTFGNVTMTRRFGGYYHTALAIRTGTLGSL